MKNFANTSFLKNFAGQVFNLANKPFLKNREIRKI